MGADPFTIVAFGGTAQDAFRAAVEDAAYEHGHGGYTGTIAEKDSFRTFEVPALTGAPDEAVQAWVTGVMSWQPEDPEMRRIAEAVEDKWGPAGHIPLSGDRHLFFGWASS
jgi:hypothetical protein